MGYPQKEGRYGPIYQIAEGISVLMDARGTWMVLAKSGSKRKKRSVGKTEEDRQRAIRAAELVAIKMGLALEKQADTEGKTFERLVEEWYDLNEQRWQPGTRERYRYIIRDFLRPLYKLPLDRVDRQRIKRLLVDLLKIRSANTVEVVHAVISGIFSEAIDLGYTDKNPAYGLLRKILPPKNKRNLSEPDPFNLQDRDRFLKAAGDRLPKPFPVILEIMAMSGMRLGEALAMCRENLDVLNCQYQVTETTRQGRFGPPKSGKRLVDLDAPLVAKLEVYVKELQKESFRTGVQAHYLFPGVTQRMVQTAMRRACLAARLRPRSPHDLRHTYSTILLMSHISPAYVQKQLGHHSIAMTVDIYGHWIPGEGRDRLDKALRPEGKPGNPMTQAQGQE